MSKTQEQVDKLDQEFQTLLTAINSDKVVKEELEKEIDAKNAELASLGYQIEENAKKAENDKKVLAGLDEQVSVLRDEVSGLQLQKDEKVSDIKRLEDEAAKKSDELKAQFESDKEEKQAEITKLEQSVASLDSEIEARHNTISESQTSIANLENIIKDKEAKKDELNAEITELQAYDKVGLILERDNIEADIRNGKQNYEDLKADVEKKKNELADLTEEQKQENKKIDEIRSKRIDEEKLYNAQVKKRLALVDKEEKLKRANEIIKERYALAGIEYEEVII